MDAISPTDFITWIIASFCDSFGHCPLVWIWNIFVGLGHLVFISILASQPWEDFFHILENECHCYEKKMTILLLNTCSWKCSFFLIKPCLMAVMRWQKFMLTSFEHYQNQISLLSYKRYYQHDISKMKGKYVKWNFPFYSCFVL